MIYGNLEIMFWGKYENLPRAASCNFQDLKHEKTYFSALHHDS